jgi:hypothetical protein
VAVSRSALEPAFAGAGPPAKPTTRERRAIVALIAFGVLLALLIGVTQDPVTAAVPLILAVAVWAITKTRRWYLLLGLMFFYQFVGISPMQLPGSPYNWLPPLVPVYRFFVTQLPIHMSGLELCYMGLFALAGIRWLLGIRIDSEKREPGSRLLYIDMLAILFAIVFIEIRGISRGGADVQQSLWQFHGLMWIPLLTMLLGSSMRSAREAAALAWVFTIAAMVKITWAAHLYWTVAKPFGLRPDAMTTHEDSVLFVMVLFIWISAAVHRPSKASLARLVFFGGYILWGLALNNRRIAYVGLGVGLFVFYLLLQGRLKRIATKTFVYAIPFVVVYLAIGKDKPRGIFKPAAMIMSVGKQEDASSKTRDIENYNLIQTLKPNMVFGTGWGHEYIEVVRAFDISTVFAQYRYIAHNSMLWLISIGGIVGFTLLWVPFSIAVFLGVRAYRFADNWFDRTAASSALSVLAIFVVQAWGDMGTQGMWSGQVISSALVVIAKLAYSTGAWPAGIKIFGENAERRRPKVPRAQVPASQVPA